MQKHRTASVIDDYLAALGIESFRCGGTGVVGVIRNGDGPTVAFRADSDGLPLKEETGLPYPSNYSKRNTGRDYCSAVSGAGACGLDPDQHPASTIAADHHRPTRGSRTPAPVGCRGYALRAAVD